MTLSSLRNKFRTVNLKPTEKQKHAGNYKKGHIRLHGLDITIENTKGSTRSGMSADGRKWESTLPDHYGYIKHTTGADSDHVDCYIGPEPEANRIFVIDQKHHRPGYSKHGKFDEHKCMIGYASMEDAKKAYRAAFSDGHDRALACTVMTIAKFKDWLHNYDTTKAVNYFIGHKK